jgi:hypothetical protein
MGAKEFKDLKDFHSNGSKVRSVVMSSRTGKKTVKNQVHVVDDFSSFDA